MLFWLEISSVLEIRFQEPDWYKAKCKSALVWSLFLYGLPSLCISFQVNMDLRTCCSIVPPKTANSTDGYRKTLTSWVSAPVGCSEANFYYCDTGNAILMLWYCVLKSFYHTN
jgi:hypothetical protein